MFLPIIAFLPVLILTVIFFFVAKAEANDKEKIDMSLKKAYLYLVSVISLVIAVVGAIMLINMALKTWVFPKADQNYYSYPCPVQPAPIDGKPVPCDQAALDLQKKTDQENQASQKQRDAAEALAMLIVATPVWWFHWRLAKREV